MELLVFGLVLLAAAGLFILPLFMVLYRKEKRRRQELERRFSGVIDATAKVAELKSTRDKIQTDIDDVRSTYREKRALLTKLQKEVAIYDESLSFAELGVYEPHFDFGDSESYKAGIKLARDRQKEIVKVKRAVTCDAEWTLEGSRAKGETMTNRQIRLTLRAFNNECDAAIANTRWNNVNAMEKRIVNAAKQIDKLNLSNKVVIEDVYLNLKLKELYLTHEYREKVKLERDERREVARLAREEQKLVREAENAEAEEEKYRLMLEKARAELVGADVGDVERMQSRIASLETDLADAHAATDRARSMAEMTRSGYVYIISNVGSFGDDVVKIGLTRRLDPEDRVRELGDASVPFIFDTHALIYSEDAPGLENALHTEFHERRVNAANMRKEFFRVGLEEVAEAVGRLAPDASFFRDIEAQDYHETLARRQAEANRLVSKAESTLPATI